MATITPVAPKREANSFSFSAAAAGGDEFVNNGSELLLFEHTNGAGSDMTLTIVTQQTVDGEAVADKAITVGKGTIHLLGPFPTGIYNDANGKVQLLGRMPDADVAGPPAYCPRPVGAIEIAKDHAHRAVALSARHSNIMHHIHAHKLPLPIVQE